VDFTAFVDEEFSKVPTDFASGKRALGAEVVEDRVRVVTVDIGLGEHFKHDTISASSKCFYLRVGAWLLPEELVAREGKYLEPAAGKFLM
jgi:hypothetical protein